MKKQHWYLEGWSYDETTDERQRKVLKYHGDYYCMSMSPRQLMIHKICYMVVLLAIYALYLLLGFSPAQGLQVVYVGVCSILSIIPLIFLGMGVVCFVHAPRTMTYRAYYAGYKRTKSAALATAILLGESAVGQIVFLIIHGGSVAAMGQELLLLAFAVVIAALSLSLVYSLGRIQVDILPNEAVDPASAKQRR